MRELLVVLVLPVAVGQRHSSVGYKSGDASKVVIVVSGTITGPRTEGHPHDEQSIPCP
jgi:hypothetical protein